MQVLSVTNRCGYVRRPWHTMLRAYASHLRVSNILCTLCLLMLTLLTAMEAHAAQRPIIFVPGTMATSFNR